ncbi:MAG: DUF86 domain-containing protein [Desulfobacterales bacterium]
MNDVVINKIQTIRRCIARARDEFEKSGDEFDTDYTRQDAAILNLLRACEQPVDLANHVIRTYKMGIPAGSAESFLLLADQSVIDREMALRLGRMVQFRNIVIHEYRKTHIGIVKSVIQKECGNLLDFAAKIKSFVGKCI